MPATYREITAAVSSTLTDLRSTQPDVQRAFSTLGHAALRDGALDRKTKELIAMALSVAARCDPCLGFHAQALARVGCTRAEFEEMLGVCVYMGGGPSLMYAAHALDAFVESAGAAT